MMGSNAADGNAVRPGHSRRCHEHPRAPEQVGESCEENPLDDRQTYFSKQLNYLFCRVRRRLSHKIQAEILKILIRVQQSGRRVPITLKEKVDKKLISL